jgi:hypothetical protein
MMIQVTPCKTDMTQARDTTGQKRGIEEPHAIRNKAAILGKIKQLRELPWEAT